MTLRKSDNTFHTGLAFLPCSNKQCDKRYICICSVHKLCQRGFFRNRNSRWKGVRHSVRHSSRHLFEQQSHSRVHRPVSSSWKWESSQDMRPPAGWGLRPSRTDHRRSDVSVPPQRMRHVLMLPAKSQGRFRSHWQRSPGSSQGNSDFIWFGLAFISTKSGLFFEQKFEPNTLQRDIQRVFLLQKTTNI